MIRSRLNLSQMNYYIPNINIWGQNVKVVHQIDQQVVTIDDQLKCLKYGGPIVVSGIYMQSLETTAITTADHSRKVWEVMLMMSSR